jgi:hypothetical protein
MRHSKLLFLGLQLLLCWGAPAVRAQSEWTELVDGKGLAGWRGEARFWSVEDGAIVGRSTKETPCDATTYLLRDGLEFEDFELVAEYKVVGGNSGIQFRSKDLGGHQVAGPQADIEDGDSWSGCLYEQDGRGVMTTRGERCVFADGRKDARRFADGKELQRRAVRRHDWNTYRVVAVGGTIVLEINGVRTSETVDRDPARAVRGLVAVQLHAGPPMEVRYRSIKVRRLGPADEPKLDEIGHGTAELHLLPGPLPHWLWAGEQPGQSERVLLEREFVVPFAPAWARLLASGDNHVVAWINGRRLFVHDDWSRLAGADATGAVVEGANALQLAARNDGGPAGAWCELVVAAADGRRMRLVSDASFSSISLVGEVDIESLDPASIERGRTGPAHSFGAMGVAPWGMIDDQDGATSDARVPAALGADDIELAEGFAIELMHQPDPATQGSWVALCEAPGGFLYAADQYGSIWRARMAARPLEFARVPAAISGAHGLLWHGGALHCVVAEGSDGARTGLWRVDDADGDGLPDSPRLLRAFEGGGEHGPHGLVTGPDGRIWIVGGNHTALPDCTTSRVPRLWAEDDLVPTIEDPRGHANGIRAPGGWIVAVDDDGRDFELWSMGYRNAYDLAFDARGELYTWDSDMEWDVGAPWYRPVRIVQAVSGSDFGWRTGSSNWPTSWLDTLPSTADLGRGSPTGLVFGTGLAAPERWQRALYACDWSFGTIWALDVDEAGAGSRAAAIPFLRGTPFPATDIIVGSDGALWISTGGRRTRSGVYRAHWNGGGSFAPAAVPPASGSLVARRALERLHGPGRAWSADDARGVLAALRGGDRHLAHAARAALEHADAARFDAIVAAAGAPDADLVLVALRRFPVERRALALEHLARLERDSLEALRDWLRLAQLACLRLAPLSGAEEAALRAQVEALEFRGDERDAARPFQRGRRLVAPRRALGGRGGAGGPVAPRPRHRRGTRADRPRPAAALPREVEHDSTADARRRIAGVVRRAHPRALRGRHPRHGTGAPRRRDPRTLARAGSARRGPAQGARAQLDPRRSPPAARRRLGDDERRAGPRRVGGRHLQRLPPHRRRRRLERAGPDDLGLALRGRGPAGFPVRAFAHDLRPVRRHGDPDRGGRPPRGARRENERWRAEAGRTERPGGRDRRGLDRRQAAVEGVAHARGAARPSAGRRGPGLGRLLAGARALNAVRG